MSGRGRGGRGRGGNNNPLHTGGRKEAPGGGGRDKGDGIGGVGFRSGGRGGRGGQGGGRGGYAGAKKQEEFGGGGKKEVARGFNGGGKKEYVEVRKRTKEESDLQDAEFGFEDFREGPDRLGWLVTYSAVTVVDPDTGAEVSAVDYYFVQQDGSKFKVMYKYQPYFYVVAEADTEREVESVLRRKFADQIADIVHRDWWDLDKPNHLAGNKQRVLMLKFRNVKDLMEVRKEVTFIVQRNQEKKKEQEKGPVADAASASGASSANMSNRLQESVLDAIIDVREYDVPYVMRVAIDNEIFVGLWYSVSSVEGHTTITGRPDLTATWGRAEPRVLAFDIECTKEPLKFPNPEIDSIYMISYMVDGEGFLIVNREIVTEDIEDFDYTPKKEYEGPFTCINVANEEELLRTWLDHVKDVKPLVFVTYNGDFFDFPFVDKRMQKYGMDMEEEIGMQKQQSEEYGSRFACHLDAFHWVNRDSYLPQGSRGLKSVTKHKLGYDPVEISPEDMLPKARQAPQEMASYSVSDAVATYYLYMQYVHPFIFSLCNIIPMTPGDVLRKGSGTLCETLLQVEAYRGQIICPNKYKDDPLKMYNGHLIESETYVGGHVEALNSGVFRDDFLYKFSCDPDAFDELIDNLDRDLKFAIEDEGGKKLEDVEDYDAQKQGIIDRLREIQATPRREERPSIYHLDVAAMYPNIILTNRLQPPAMVTKQTCASCDFYSPDMKCRRDMEWKWRGEMFPTTRSEVKQLEGQLKADSETFEASASAIKARVKTYSQKVYKRTHDTVTETRTAHVCQRENSFYIDTVLAFRDRRYEYKGLVKKWGAKLREAEAEADQAKIKECKGFVVIYDSLQLAHKCILNSFYGYVMRKGARWYSMEMAGVVTHKGGHIIRVARQLVERIGIPLELDTDGIWCCLPKSFPDGIEFRLKGQKKPFVISYPTSMLNAQTHADCVNPQYHTLIDQDKQQYKVSSECSILFELDGPYKAMILPAAKEEGKRLKKRYAVFNFDGSLAELKGFELKRRGELQLVKTFQSEVFKRFLDGGSLDECYQSVASVANLWLDVLDNKGVDLEDDQLIDLISEASNMSKTMEEYGDRKSMAITTAKRMAQFLGDDMIKDKGLACRYIVSRSPEGTPVTERAIPVEIFKAGPQVQDAYLRRWCSCSSLVQSSLDIRSILDWGYYRERLSSTIQKIVTIPAAMQLVTNPVPRVPHPEWLVKQVREQLDPFKQNKLSSFFSKETPQQALERKHKQPEQCADDVMDIESMGGGSAINNTASSTVVKYKGAGAKGKRKGGPEPIATSDTPLPPLEDGTIVLSLNPVEAYGTTMWTDFDAWHAHMRVLWRNKINERKRRNAELDDDTGRLKYARTAAGGGMRGFFQSRHHSMLNRHWEVLEVVPMGAPGMFKVWAILEDGSLQALNLEVPREFYVNYRDGSGKGGKSGGVTRKLPFGKQVFTLERFEISEKDYVEHSKEIAGEFADPSVEGLYETQVPLLFRAIVNMGCVCSVNRRPGGFREQVTRKGARPDTISLSDIKFENTAQCPYLPSKQKLSKIYIYHSKSDSDGGQRGLLAVFAPLDTFKSRVWVINKYAQSQKPPLAKVLKESATELDEMLTGSERGTARALRIERWVEKGVDFEIDTSESHETAWFELNEVLKQYQEENVGTPSIVMLQSAQSATELCEVHGQTLRDFPVVEVPFTEEDNSYEPLGWESKAGKDLIRNYVAIDDYFTHILQSSRYSHIPISNLRGDTLDDATTMTDVLFSRLLKNNNYVLWASQGSAPDCGTGDVIMPYETEETTNPDVNFPAGTRTACMSLEINNLALTSVVHSKEIEDEPLHGGNGSDQAIEALVASGAIPLASVLVDETTLCTDSFRMLQYMADSWVKDAKFRQNAHADKLQMNMWRWINNTRSLFYSPALQRHVSRLVRKAFGLLVSKLRGLGAEVLHASFYQLVISTKKPSIGQAEGYVEYMINEIQQVPAFELLQLVPTATWARLVFQDRFNYAGLLHAPRGSPEEEAALVDPKADRDLLERGLVVVQEWDIAQHLPSKYRRRLLEMVADFLCRPMKYRFSLEGAGGDDGAGAGSPGRGAMEQLGSPGFTQTRRKVEEVMALEGDFIKGMFRSLSAKDVMAADTTTALSNVNGFESGAPEFSKRLFDEISRDVGAPPQFPLRPGSHLEMSNAKLEFLKQVCFIFGLDAEIKPDVDVMKRSLLKLLMIREFSPQAQFENPSRSLLVPDLFCNSGICSASRDADLCRDRNFVDAVVGTPGTADVELRAQCNQCGLHYSSGAVEERLVHMARDLKLRYNRQDLKCRKCKRAATMMMSMHCECSGTYELCLPPEKIVERVETMEGVADYYGFSWLKEELNNILPRPEAEEEQPLAEEITAE